MKEIIGKNLVGDTLTVYPNLLEEASDEDMLFAESVEALQVYTPKNKKVWAVHINLYADPITSKAETDRLKAAIDRCWEWIETQKQGE